MSNPPDGGNKLPPLQITGLLGAAGNAPTRKLPQLEPRDVRENPEDGVENDNNQKNKLNKNFDLTKGGGVDPVRAAVGYNGT